MPTQTPSKIEEQQAKDFLKRAEIRTMKKDLLKLREADSLKERDKIINIKTLDEQEAEQAKQLEAAKLAVDKSRREEILQKNAAQERVIEKDLKKYANEQERQKIFLLESQRLTLEKKSDEIDETSTPALKLDKNKITIEKRKWEDRLNSILEKEKKLESEQNFIVKKAQETTIPTERKSLEARRWEIDAEIKNIEKKRWQVEKQIQDINNKVRQINASLQQLITEKNSLRGKVLGIDKSIRDIYSMVIIKVEEKRRKEAEERESAQTESAKVRATQREKIRRQQWTHSAPEDRNQLKKIPIPARKKRIEPVEEENERRKQFMQNVENSVENEKKLELQIQPKKTIQTPTSASVPLPPVPTHIKPPLPARPSVSVLPTPTPPVAPIKKQ